MTSTTHRIARRIPAPGGDPENDRCFAACPDCDENGIEETVCPVCNGTGEWYSSMTATGRCVDGCGGFGVVDRICETCGGSLEIEVTTEGEAV